MVNLTKIQELCQKYGISIPKLEKKMGFSNGAIYKWPVNTPGIDKVQKVANYFDVSIDSLMEVATCENQTDTESN